MVNLALVGYGYWGPNVARNIFESKQTKLYSICDIREERIDLAKGKYLEQTRYTTNYNDFLDNPDIDAIAIATETEFHYTIAKEAILAGKNIFLEKPITQKVSEAEELILLAKEKNVQIHVDHIMIFHPSIKYIKQLIDKGELGELIYFDSSRLNLGKIKDDVSAMWDLAVHDLAIIDFLIDGKTPHYITAMGEKFWSKKESLTFLNLKYDKFLAQLKSSWISPIKERRMIIAGTKKMIVFDDIRSAEKLIIYDKGFEKNSKFNNVEYSEYALEVRDGDALIPSIPIEDALKNSIEHFVNCLMNNSESISGPKQALRIMKILEEADLFLSSN